MAVAMCVETSTLNMTESGRNMFDFVLSSAVIWSFYGSTDGILKHPVAKMHFYGKYMKEGEFYNVVFSLRSTI